MIVEEQDMLVSIEEKKSRAANWFKQLRDQICQKFEEIDNCGKFERKHWDYKQKGGGEISLMRGKIFEKVGVNFSMVEGSFDEKFSKEIPGTENSSNFWACGISLVAHMTSPFVPAVHMNTRFIVTSKAWFGGGADLTPTFPNDQDKDLFHSAFRKTCDKYNSDYYPKFSKWADDYFYLPHRQEHRGIGGIFYDYLDSGNWDQDFSYTQDIGSTFLDVYSQIVLKNKDLNWTEEERKKLLLKRGRYAEFNLLYDRGTKFGLMTGGNTEAILMSLPPEVNW